MDQRPRSLWSSVPFKIATIYLVVSVLWIVFSDQLVAMLIQDNQLITRVQTLKGWFFVGSTALLIYVLLRREIDVYRKTAESLAQSSQELRDILDAMPVGVIMTDGTTIEYINVNFSQRYGYSLDEIPTDEQLFLLAYPDPQYREPMIAEWQQAFMRARVQGTPIPPFEIRITCKNGEVRQAITNTQLIGNRLVIIYTDITERELLHNELVKIQKLESIGLLAGGLAHDFNNILTGIMGNLSFAQILLDAEHPASGPLKAAEDAATRAVELTGQLLTFARGGEPLKKVLAIGELINESMTLMLRGSKVRGACELGKDLWCIEADGGQISQVLNNIIINAVQAMPDGGQLRISAENCRIDEGAIPALQQGQYVRICLQDSGEGMTPETLERVFDPYFTTKAEGSGLGLASAYSIINRHGGNIAVESSPGQGTRFSLLLPATEAKPTMREPEKPAVVSFKDDRRRRILVMDDEAAICGIASAMLDYLGYEVDTCSDGIEAIARYEQAFAAGQSYAVVLMDLTIPGGLGGKEAAQQILARDPEACLIVSSGYSHDPIMADYRSYGFKGVLAKPYKVGALGQVLAEVLPGYS
ncbi:MAG: ATP-binding protein [Desulfobulbus sp.]